MRTKAAVTNKVSDENAADSVTKDALARIDQSGRVAKLFSISAAVSGVAGAESPEHTSRYELIRRLGQGGLGTVWLAHDKSLLAVPQHLAHESPQHNGGGVDTSEQVVVFCEHPPNS